MRPNLKDGLLSIAMSKPEAKKLLAAKELCEMVSHLSPIDAKLSEAIASAVSGITAICRICVKEEAPRPLIDNLPSPPPAAPILPGLDSAPEKP